jgi:Flp pilus assembly protein TadD
MRSQASTKRSRANPRDVAALINRGNALHSLRRFADALAAFDAVLDLAPRNADARYNRGNALLALGRTEEAVASFDAAIALRPNQAEMMLNRGIALAALGRQLEALEMYRAVLAIDPRRAEAHYNSGNALHALERDVEAVASYDAALALQPQHADAHWNLAWALLALGDYETGLARARMALEEPALARAAATHIGAAVARRTGMRRSQAARAFGAGHRRYGAIPALCAASRSVRRQGDDRAAARASAVLRPVSQARHAGLRRRAAARGTISTARSRRFRSRSEPASKRFPRRFRTSKRIRSSSPAGARRSTRSRDVARRSRLGGKSETGERGPARDRSCRIACRCSPFRECVGIACRSGSERRDLPSLRRPRRIDLSPQLTDFAETAAAIANLDLVITTDTAVAHHRGCYGKTGLDPAQVRGRLALAARSRR